MNVRLVNHSKAEQPLLNNMKIYLMKKSSFPNKNTNNHTSDLETIHFQQRTEWESSSVSEFRICELALP